MRIRKKEIKKERKKKNLYGGEKERKKQINKEGKKNLDGWE